MHTWIGEWMCMRSSGDRERDAGIEDRREGNLTLINYWVKYNNLPEVLKTQAHLLYYKLFEKPKPPPSVMKAMTLPSDNTLRLL